MGAGREQAFQTTCDHAARSSPTTAAAKETPKNFFFGVSFIGQLCYTAIMKTKKCPKCGGQYSLDCFYRDPHQPNGYKSWCKICFRKEQRINNLRRKGAVFSTAELQELLAASDGCCMLCGEPERFECNDKPKQLSADHDHKTGHLRGLVCTECNLHWIPMLERHGFEKAKKLITKTRSYLAKYQ